MRCVGAGVGAGVVTSLVTQVLQVIGQFVACLCEFHNTTYGSSHTPDDYISYEFMHVWKCSKDEVLR